MSNSISMIIKKGSKPSYLRTKQAMDIQKTVMQKFKENKQWKGVHNTMSGAHYCNKSDFCIAVWSYILYDISNTLLCNLNKKQLELGWKKTKGEKVFHDTMSGAYYCNESDFCSALWSLHLRHIKSTVMLP